ncbi:MAG: hypothetical protein ACOYMG_27455 [Candidatus Methylumidiphilus sp.]
MTTSAFEMYRFYHEDGSSKDWAVRNNGDGTVTTRWGPTASALPSSSTRRKSAHALIGEKMGKGYLHMGTFEIDENGQILSHPLSSSQRQTAQAQVETKIYWRIKPPAIDDVARSGLASQVASLNALWPIDGWQGMPAIEKLCKRISARSASGQIAKEDSIQPVLWLMALKSRLDYVHMSDEAGIDISTDIIAETGVLSFFETDIATIRPLAEKIGLLRARINIATVATAEIEDCWF